VRCRCSSLTTLDVEEQISFKAVFEGRGQTPAAQRSSMQQQIEAFSSGGSRSISGLLAPSSWSAHQCLTAFRLRDPRISARPPPLEMLHAALRTPSLVNLQADLSGAGAAEAAGGLHHVSNLTNLTHLCFRMVGILEPGLDAPEWHLLRAAVEHLGGLQRLTLSGTAARTVLPGSCLDLSRLSRLTYLELAERGLCVDLRGLSAAVPALRSLCMTERNRMPHDTVGTGCLASLFQLTGLTSLDGPCTLEPAPGQPAMPSDEAPEEWRRGLLSLRWHAASGGGVPPAVPQLTSLTLLGLRDACVSPEFCR
jgi:hypothetical protein